MDSDPDTPRAAPPLIGLDAAVAALSPLRLRLGRPPVLHQFWDRDPPRQIRKLLRHNARLCRGWGLTHEVWDAARARAQIAEDFPDLLPLIDRAPHPAMASDLIRLCLLHRFGGLYLDADMALRAKGGARLAPLLQGGLVFKWSLPDRSNLPNWCFGFAQGHPMLSHLIEVTATSMERALRGDPEVALRNILNVSGPGLFTRAIGSWIAAYGAPPGFLVLDVEDAYKMVQNGPDLLKAPLQYKQTPRHWLVAGRETGDGTGRG